MKFLTAWITENNFETRKKVWLYLIFFLYLISDMVLEVSRWKLGNFVVVLIISQIFVLKYIYLIFDMELNVAVEIGKLCCYLGYFTK